MTEDNDKNSILEKLSYYSFRSFCRPLLKSTIRYQNECKLAHFSKRKIFSFERKFSLGSTK
ncbi:hypothetical protein LEP1GSC016_4184 [Leptospira borgpetersenii serovar Hardjo-bovis str. Sponselee]|uniref:Uncharacterized protein n=1 Tax=Leptospira borgpetersenii serovar Hardjo-bovis str. Sponselee TaxID=1303729 RepID=M6BEQ1_LEPBO|nr:hypothetical protein B9T54_03290 [Leptospira borgpetersenii serovar Hardjo-bovis]AYR07704.1 hypothetical protein D1609_03245 [Leptospira borgpetersenii serovar Hardjo-bovis]EMJ78182.1 hypothetical protein LEP1GSC016_4184 [Leptospira borgpetersenii serovar Hardjo-bovis str. Sponselee]